MPGGRDLLILMQECGGPAVMADDPGGRAHGLLHGSSGAALFLVRMYEQTGELSYLDGATSALDRDLANCQTMPRTRT